MTALMITLAVVSGAGGTYRWTWVSQKEHYLTPSATKFAWRWFTSGGVATACGVVALGAAAAAVPLGVLAPRSGAIVGIVAVTAAAVFPPTMSVGAIRLVPTRRALTQLAVAVVFMGCLGLGVVAASGSVVTAAVVVVLAPMLVDSAAWAVAPLERRLARRFIVDAKRRLATVGPRVVAITGSFGKTSTKNHLADLISDSFVTVASPASWNNSAGLARTVNEYVTPGTEVLVAEMGTYGPGEIAGMCSWVRPEVAVICEIGPMHLERMRSIEAIVTAKAEIVETASHVVLWVDNAHLDALATRLDDGKKVWRVGTAAAHPAGGLDVEVRAHADSPEIFWGETSVGHLPRELAVKEGNVACAVAAALALGCTPSKLSRGIASLSAPPHRAVASRGRGVWVIDDTYNANPAGAASALDQLESLGADGYKVVVTPGMIELGPTQSDANRRFAESVAGAGAHLVIVGKTNRRALRDGFGATATEVRSREAARQWLAEHTSDSDAILWENDLPPHLP